MRTQQEVVDDLVAAYRKQGTSSPKTNNLIAELVSMAKTPPKKPQPKPMKVKAET